MSEFLVGDRIVFSDSKWIGPAYYGFELGDTLSLLDRSDTQAIFPGDTLGLTDAVLIQIIQTNFEILDGIGLSDGIGYLLTWKTAATDALALSDSLLASANWEIPIADTLALSDTRGLFWQAPTTDTLSLSDAAAVTLANVPALSVVVAGQDIIILTDSVSYILSGKLSSISDRLIILDEVKVIFNSTLSAYLRRYLNDV